MTLLRSRSVEKKRGLRREKGNGTRRFISIRPRKEGRGAEPERAYGKKAVTEKGGGHEEGRTF